MSTVSLGHLSRDQYHFKHINYMKLVKIGTENGLIPNVGRTVTESTGFES